MTDWIDEVIDTYNISNLDVGDEKYFLDDFSFDINLLLNRIRKETKKNGRQYYYRTIWNGRGIPQYIVLGRVE